MAPRYRAPLPADAGGPFVNGAEKANDRPEKRDGRLFFSSALTSETDISS